MSGLYPYPISSLTRLAGEDIPARRVVMHATVSSNLRSVVCGGANSGAGTQAATQALVPFGIAVRAAKTAGPETTPDVVTEAGSVVEVDVGGAATLNRGEWVVAEYNAASANAGKVIGEDSSSLTVTAGTHYYVGRVEEPGDNGKTAMIRLMIKQKGE